MTGNTGLELGTLENWLWEAACVIRGPIDAPKYKDYILPLIFFKAPFRCFRGRGGQAGRRDFRQQRRSY